MEKILDIFNTFDFRQYSGKSRDPIFIKGVELNYINKGAQGYVYSIQYENIKLALKIQLNMEEHEKYLTNYIIKLKNKPHIINIINIRSVKNFTFVLMDFYDGELWDWLKSSHTDKEWMLMVKHILLGIQFMQDKLKICHNDLKPKNILYKKKDTGYEFVIADFGWATILKSQNRIQQESTKLCIENNTDFYNMQTLPKRIKVNWLIKYYNRQQLINIIKSNNDVRFDSYYNQEKKKIWKDLHKYPQKIKQIMLTKSISYYIIERRYDIGNIPDKIKVQKLPSEKIIKFIEKVFSMKGNIQDILDSNF